MRHIGSALLGLLASSALAQLQVDCQPESTICGYPGGTAHAYVSGGLAPYTYQWNTGDTIGSIFNLLPGTYTVTVTDANLDQVVGSCDVIDEQILDWSSWVGQGMLSPCQGQCNGGFRVHKHPAMIDPITLVSNPPLPPGPGAYIDAPALGGGCAGQVYTFSITDANGCGGTGTATIWPEVVMSVDVPQTAGACSGNDNGTATVRAIYPTPQDGLPWVPALTCYVEDGMQNQVQPINSVVNGDTTTFIFNNLPPGPWTALVINDRWQGQLSCSSSAPFTIADLGFNCGAVSGRMFLDEDADCSQAVDEIGMADQLMIITPGPYYAITDANGDYAVGLPYGSYTMAQLNADAVQRCPATAPIPFDVINGQPDPVIDIADSLITPFDLESHVNNSIARPGFTFDYWIGARNPSGYPGDPVTLDFTWDPIFTYVSSSLAPTTLGASNGQWQLPAAQPFDYEGIVITLQVPANPGLIGTVHSATLVATSTMTEVNTTNNADVEDLTVMGSYDPNDKQSRTSSNASGDVYFLDLDEYIDYTIRFQNTGTDTAFTVVVTDTISPLLDLSSLQILASSHGYVPSIVGSDLLKFTFNNILLADSTTNEPASHGFVSFRLKLASAAQNTPGLVIANNADIFFDFNPAVRTNTTELTTDFSVGMAAAHAAAASVYPVPVTDVLHVRTADGVAISRLQVLGMDGRLLMDLAGTNMLRVEALPAGAYALRIRMANGAQERLRFVKR